MRVGDTIEKDVSFFFLSNLTPSALHRASYFLNVLEIRPERIATMDLTSSGVPSSLQSSGCCSPRDVGLSLFSSRSPRMQRVSKQRVAAKEAATEITAAPPENAKADRKARQILKQQRMQQERALLAGHAERKLAGVWLLL